MSASRSVFAILGLAAWSALGCGCRLVVELVETNAGTPDGATSCGAWTHPPATFEPCDVPAPTESLELGDGVWTFDTNSGSLTDPNNEATFPTSALLSARGDVEARAVSIERFSLTAGATLHVRGKRPLIVVSWSDADLRGSIDATSRAGIPGAGANPSACADAPSGNGADSVNGAAGGGGGGFGTGGAPGGTGEDGNAAAGGAGGVATVNVLRGGCAGGAGGNALHGAGGDGGGAVVIAARDHLVLDGSIVAGGAGGGAAQGGHAGGGGGGSGGFVGLSGASIRLGPTAIVAANGGGGGGGSDITVATAGQDGQPSSSVAAAGLGQGMGSSGGAGGARGTTPKPGVSSHRGGGGGGGAVGVIQFDSLQQTLDPNSVISPP